MNDLDKLDATYATLTPAQKVILLRLCEAYEGAGSAFVKLAASARVRETSTGCALVRKGLAKRLNSGHFAITDDGYWLGDTFRAEARRRASVARAAHLAACRGGCDTLPCGADAEWDRCKA